MEGKESKLNLFLIIIIAFLSVAVALIVVLLLITGGNINNLGIGNKEDTKAEKKVEIDHKKAVGFPVSEMVINIKPNKDNKKAIIKISVSITLADSKFEEEFKKREAEVKDIIRSTFNNKTAEELEGEKIDKVKEELLHKLKEMYKEPKEAAKVLEVFFPDTYITELN